MRRTAEVTVTFEVIPFEVVNVDDTVGIDARTFKHEDSSVLVRLGLVVVRGVQLEKSRAVERSARVGVGGVARGDEFLDPVLLEVERKELGEVAPLGVITRHKDGFISKDVGDLLEVGAHLPLDVRPLGIELVLFGSSSCGKIGVFVGRAGCSLKGRGATASLVGAASGAAFGPTHSPLLRLQSCYRL